MVILLQVRHYTLLDITSEGEHFMTSNQDDKTTAKHLAITFTLFFVLGVVLIVGANIIG